MIADVRHIEAFLAVARCSHFTRAAADLHVSQSALTVQIRQLEAALGVRLFDRNNRSVALTPAGRELVGPLERVLVDLRSIADQAHDLVSRPRGIVTVACLPSVAASVLPRAIAALTAQHHGIVVRTHDVVAERVLEMVRSGEADFGVGDADRVDRKVTAQPLITDRLSAFVPAGHALAGRRSVTVRELAGQPLVLTRKDSSVRTVLERALRGERLEVAVAQEVTYMATALGMTAAGVGIAVLPDAAAALAPAGVTRVAIRGPVLTRQIAVLLRAGRSLSPAATQLVELLRRERPAISPKPRCERPCRARDRRR
jgi:LysR family transcriptional regulator, carnitine catabolism transcriptional activator